jgi:ribosome-binding protein aMBF1 (putative translation factor)
MKKKKTADALEILKRRHPPSPSDLETRTGYRQKIEIAELIHRARVNARLSQRELAERVGTTASVICRLEDADYDGHSLGILRRIARALGQRVEVRFVRETNASMSA